MGASPAITYPASGRRVPILLPLPLSGAFDYLVREGLSLEAGDFVRVPLGTREVIGVVWDEGEENVGLIDESQLKNVSDRLATPALPTELRRFIDWVANYTLTPAGAVLRMAMSVSKAMEATSERTGFVQTAVMPQRLTPGRQRVLDLLAEGPPRTKKDLITKAEVSPSVVAGLVKIGALTAVILEDELTNWPSAASGIVPQLSTVQAHAADNLRSKVRKSKFGVVLLDGVTGSGKTEVYFEAAEEAISSRCQVLVLLPEISLTPQWLKRCEERFGMRPVEWHSDLTSAARRRNWRDIASGRVPMVVGARSALFLPFPKLGLIIVDEEHDASFKQEEGVIYNARDMAVVRGSLADCPTVLVSATPSLETVTNVKQKRYELLQLPDRHGTAQLPDIRALDMRENVPARGRWLSSPLAEALAETVSQGEQAMLFLNRRGYAPLTLCRACGHRIECPNCSAWLVEHRLNENLQCHHCGYHVQVPGLCPSCGGKGNFAPCGPGVERIAEEVRELLPTARLAIMASDTMTSAAKADGLVQKVETRAIDILVGTQIMAKGHHFPLLTLVGVVDADLGLGGGDLRAAERTYQLLMQVAGRAGRSKRPGCVILQTYMPEHPVIEALISGDRKKFMAREEDERRAHGMPPFGRLAALIISGADEIKVKSTARELGKAAPSIAGTRILGPAEAPLSLIRGRYRMRFLLRCERKVNVQGVLKRWLTGVKNTRGVRVQVDIDPYSFL